MFGYYDYPKTGSWELTSKLTKPEHEVIFSAPWALTLNGITSTNEYSPSQQKHKNTKPASSLMKNDCTNKIK